MFTGCDCNPESPGFETRSSKLLNCSKNSKTNIAADMRTSRDVSCGDTTAFWIPAWQGCNHVENGGDRIFGQAYSFSCGWQSVGNMDIVSKYMMNDDDSNDSHDFPWFCSILRVKFGLWASLILLDLAQPLTTMAAVLGCWCEKAHLGDNMWEIVVRGSSTAAVSDFSLEFCSRQKALHSNKWNMNGTWALMFLWPAETCLTSATAKCHCQVASRGSRAHKNHVSAAGVSFR